jgi:hypothetical protein
VRRGADRRQRAAPETAGCARRSARLACCAGPAAHEATGARPAHPPCRKAKAIEYMVVDALVAAEPVVKLAERVEQVRGQGARQGPPAGLPAPARGPFSGAPPCWRPAAGTRGRCCRARSGADAAGLRPRLPLQPETFLQLDDSILRTIEHLRPEDSEHAAAIKQAQVGHRCCCWLAGWMDGRLGQAPLPTAGLAGLMCSSSRRHGCCCSGARPALTRQPPAKAQAQAKAGHAPPAPPPHTPTPTPTPTPTCRRSCGGCSGATCTPTVLSWRCRSTWWAGWRCPRPRRSSLTRATIAGWAAGGAAGARASAVAAGADALLGPPRRFAPRLPRWPCALHASWRAALRAGPGRQRPASAALPRMPCCSNCTTHNTTHKHTSHTHTHHTPHHTQHPHHTNHTPHHTQHARAPCRWPCARRT